MQAFFPQGHGKRRPNKFYAPCPNRRVSNVIVMAENGARLRMGREITKRRYSRDENGAINFYVECVRLLAGSGNIGVTTAGFAASEFGRSFPIVSCGL